MNHHAILDVRIGANGDRLHRARIVYFIGADHGVGADENVLADHHFAADDRGFIYIRRFGNQR